MEDFSKTNWWAYMDEPMRDLARESFELFEQESRRAGEYKWHDYSFIVFPMAKAYEGFLKKLFYNLELITKQQFMGDRFRIGRSLNPNLPKRYQSDWVFGKLVDYCAGEELPVLLWETWKQCRNQAFHYFPDHQRLMSLSEVGECLQIINKTMEKALLGCRI